MLAHAAPTFPPLSLMPFVPPLCSRIQLTYVCMSRHLVHVHHTTPQGEIGDTFFILKEGRALVTQTSKSGGRDKQLRRMEEYSCFGERALLTAEPRSANVIAETKVREAGRQSKRDKGGRRVDLVWCGVALLYVDVVDF